jgi:hypothetical protein
MRERTGRLRSLRTNHANVAQICDTQIAEDRARRWSRLGGKINPTSPMSLLLRRVVMAVGRAYLARYCELEREWLAERGVLTLSEAVDSRPVAVQHQKWMQAMREIGRSVVIEEMKTIDT